MGKGKNMKKDLKDGQWIVEVKDGKIVQKASINDGLYMVLNDNETFTAVQGCSIWQDKGSSLETEDLEQIFKGNEETDEVKCLFRF